MILDCVCVDIRISRSPLPRMLAMVLLCGYSGHGDMETLAPAPAPCEPLTCPHSCPRPASEARPGPGALLGAQIFLSTCTRLMHRIAACCTTNRIIPARLYTDWGCRNTIHQMTFSVHFRADEVGPRLSKQLGTRNSSEFCPTDLSWSTLFVDPAPGHRQWSVVSAATRPRLETFAHPLISNTQILGFMLAITRGLMAICKMIMGGRKQWWQLWDTFP